MYSVDDHRDEVANVKHSADHATRGCSVDRWLRQQQSVNRYPDPPLYLVEDLPVVMTNRHALGDVFGWVPVVEGRIVHLERLEEMSEQVSENSHSSATYSCAYWMKGLPVSTSMRCPATVRPQFEYCNDFSDQKLRSS